ncbi:MAG: glutamine--fructose-6-phosphate transaminase (isomerizing) [Anaerolineae bacterium]|jgi:glucosamine--fructose-6-phosphate aminotransferase (isomerizing)
MCGIVGYVGGREAAPIVFQGLQRLEYRGYDSAGIAVLHQGQVAVRRDMGKLENLAKLMHEQPLAGEIGIGHTRWATHGKPSQVNAHPHVDCTGQTVVIQNGIVENHHALRQKLEDKGHRFTSETDTEVIVHLVEDLLRLGADLASAVKDALHEIKGAHAIVVMSALDPGKLVAARLGHAGGVTVGIGQGEMFVASDIPAILPHTQQVIHLESGEMAVVTADGAQFWNLDGFPVLKQSHSVPWRLEDAIKEPFPTFMLKEIKQQAMVVTFTIGDRVNFETGEVFLKNLPLTTADVQEIAKIVIVACGTSVYAGRVGKYIIEKLARIPVEVDYASEFRYRDPLVDDKTVVLAITQSGETVDTLAAMEEARSKEAKLWSIVNVVGSQADRLSDGVIHMHAGPEIAVASTKAFVASLVDLYLLGLYLGQLRGTVSADQSAALVRDLTRLPALVGEVLAQEDGCVELADRFLKVIQLRDRRDDQPGELRRADCLYLARGINYPIALEGALKLKEISYLHAEGYPAGEMKHGPIALIDRDMPVVVIAVRDGVYDKMGSQIEQVKARQGRVFAVATEGDNSIGSKADHVVYIPPVSPLLTPVLTVLPLQLVAYHVAMKLGRNVDQPRNLAKSVTVE